MNYPIARSVVIIITCPKCKVEMHNSRLFPNKRFCVNCHNYDYELKEWAIKRAHRIKALKETNRLKKKYRREEG